MAHSPTVAIIGARGIGRHHARWWHLAGAQVLAHAGTSEQSVVEAAEKMAKLFPYEGGGYTDIDEMLAREQPEWVDVASSMNCHTAHVRTALEAGCDVLCEKPFCYDNALSSQVLIAQTAELVELAASLGRQLGLCSQYWIAAEECLGIFRQSRGDEAITTFDGVLASPTHGRPPDPMQLWMDLAPHLVAAAQAVAASMTAAPVSIDPLSITRDFDGYRAACSFSLRCDGRRLLDCTFTTAHTEGAGPANIRRLSLNGHHFELLGENDANGIYRSRIAHEDGDYRSDDMMHQHIARTLAGRTPITGDAIVDNQRWLFALAGRN